MAYAISSTDQQTHWVNLALEWIYLAFLALQFIMALGNRPKGEKGLYILTFMWVLVIRSPANYSVYAILSGYLIVCSIWLSVKAFASALNAEGAKTVLQKLAGLVKASNGVLVAALASTIGIYLIASIMYADPWHMFSSFPQYLVSGGTVDGDG